jgi:hypothetical protein
VTPMHSDQHLNLLPATLLWGSLALVIVAAPRRVRMIAPGAMGWAPA